MNEYFLKLKSNLELDPTLASSVSTRHTAVRTYLQNNHSPFKDSKLIGSVARKTRISPGSGKKFDIDILVVSGENNGWVPQGGIAPQAFLDQLYSTVNGSVRYGDMNPHQDAPTVTMTYADDIQVQLVPALVDMVGKDQWGNELGFIGRGYWVVKNGTWHMADYDYEADYISKQNDASLGYLIPAIKMLKALKQRYFPELGSFPLETLAANNIPMSVIVKQAVDAPILYHDLLQAFFADVPAQLSGPIKIPGSKSAPLILDPDTVQRLSKTFGVLGNYIDAINATPQQGKKIEMWRELFPDHFPATL
jgi:hypothetical protein